MNHQLDGSYIVVFATLGEQECLVPDDYGTNFFSKNKAFAFQKTMQARFPKETYEVYKIVKEEN